MTNKELHLWAYVAALMDGEGCFNIIRTTRKDNGKLSYRASIMINMTDALALAILTEIVPNSHFYCYPPSQPNRHDVFVWCLYDAHCWEFLNNVLPFLINKRQEARILKAFLAAKRRMNSYKNKKDFHSASMLRKYTKIACRMWELLKEVRQRPLDGVNSVEALKSLDFRQYRAKHEDAEALREGVTTRLMALSTTKAYKTASAPLNKI